MSALLTFMAMDLGFANEMRIAGWVTKFETLLAQGFTPEEAAQAVGMPLGTMREWQAQIAAVALPEARTFPRGRAGSPSQPGDGPERPAVVPYQRPSFDARPPIPRAVADANNHK